MAVNLTDRTGHPRAVRARRVDDAVGRARALRRRPELLSAPRRVSEEGLSSAEKRGYSPLVEVTFEASARPSPARTSAAPTPVALAAQSKPSPRALLDSDRRQVDPMFEVAVNQAQKIATAVRRTPQANLGRPPLVAGPADPVRYRLTLRGQRVLVAIGFAVAIALGAVVGTVVGAEPGPVSTDTHVVQSGDSLWSIASGLAEPGQDVRPVVQRIAEMNGLASPWIAPGQTLVVPAN